MKLTCENSNYCATVLRIHNLHDLEGLDNLLSVRAFNYQALVSKDHQVGELGLLFTAETKLCNEFCSYNNLYRHSELNRDVNKIGYIENSGRVKAIKLKGNLSTALFMPLSSLSYLGIDTSTFKEGDVFTHIDGKEVCQKYVIETHKVERKNKVKGKTKRFIRVDAVNFPEHFDTDNYWRNCHKIKDDDWVIVTDKLHGTSGRFGNIIVKRRLTWKDKVAKFFGAHVQETEHDTIAGSRRAVKDIKSEINSDHYYKEDIWNVHMDKIRHLIPKNMMFFGEIIGWVGESPIQKNYTYCIPRGESHLYIYRIAFILDNGHTFDLSWEQVKATCIKLGLRHVPEIWQGPHKDFDESIYMDKSFKDLELNQCPALDKDAPCDEGVCIRVENGDNPYILKAKSPKFLLHETKQLDTGNIDIESQQSEEF
jgi:hypothetical protein